MTSDIRRYIKLVEDVWHGTPHKFDQFSLDHVGTGEGAAAASGKLDTLVEMASPTASFQAGTFYHGTKRTAAAESILQHGIMPGNKGKTARALLQPVAGRSYLTSDLRYAIIYAIGGDMLGCDPKSVQFLMRDGEQFGYVFVIPGSTLVADVQPDEDSVGAAVGYAHDVVNKNASGAPYYSGNPLYQSIMKPENRGWAARFLSDAQRAMTRQQYQNSIMGLVSGQASGGKRFLKAMSDYDKLKLIDMGAHIAYLGPIQPTECWKIDKKRTPELAKDGSNFFDVAERIR